MCPNRTWRRAAAAAAAATGLLCLLLPGCVCRCSGGSGGCGLCAPFRSCPSGYGECWLQPAETAAQLLTCRPCCSCLRAGSATLPLPAFVGSGVVSLMRTQLGRAREVGPTASYHQLLTASATCGCSTGPCRLLHRGEAQHLLCRLQVC